MPVTSRTTRLSRLALVLALGTALSGMAAGSAFAEFKLNILHLNDPHSRIEPINRFDSTCSAEDDEAGECFGGFARLKTLIEERKAAHSGPTLVISAGDHFQGSLFYTTYGGEGEAEMANAIGVDLLALGNHEFDGGPDELRAFLDGVEFPILGANIESENLPGISDRIDPYVIADVGGERVGFVGAVASDTGETSSPGPDISFSDDIAALREAVEQVKAKGVDKIIAVTHVGLSRDREIAASIPDIDLIIGGHSHTLLSNEEEGAEPYPVVVDDTPIVQAYAYTKYLGEMVLTFDDQGVLQRLAGDPILIDASVEKDEALEARIQEMLGPIEELKAMVVGETTAPIDGDRTSCRAGECAMGNLVTDAMLDRVRDQGTDVAIQNGGGLRASIDAGEVTMGEVLTVLPFQNTLATFRLSGADIVTSLENGVSEIEEGGGRFPQVAGMSYSFDPTAEPGSRISDVMIGGQPIDPGATYGVVSNNFMRGGGDGYELFETNADEAYDFGPGLEEVLADFIRDNGPVTPMLEGRITDLSAAGAADADGEATETAEADADGNGDGDDSAPGANADVMRPADATDAAAATGVSDADPAEMDGETDADDATAGDTGASDAEAAGEGGAVEAINEAVEGTTDAVPLSAPPTVTPDGGANAASASEGAGNATDEGATETGDADGSTASGVATAADTATETPSADAVANGDEADASGATAPATAETTNDAETTDTGAAAEAAAETINDSVEEVTDTEALSEPPAIDAEASKGGTSPSDGDANGDGANEGSDAASDSTASGAEGSIAAGVEEAAETATDTPTGADQDAADGEADRAGSSDGTGDATSSDAATDGEATDGEATADGSTMDAAESDVADGVEEAADIATETPGDEAAMDDGAATDSDAASAEDTSEASDGTVDASDSTVEGDGATQADAPADGESDGGAEAGAEEAINQSVEAVTDTEALSEPPAIGSDAASDASDESDGGDAASNGDGAASASADADIAEGVEEAAETATETPSGDDASDAMTEDGDAAASADAPGTDASDSGATDASDSEAAGAMDDAAAAADAEATEAINDAVDTSTDTDALAAPPAIADADAGAGAGEGSTDAVPDEDAGGSTSDAGATSAAESDAQSTAPTDGDTSADEGEAASDEGMGDSDASANGDATDEDANRASTNGAEPTDDTSAAEADDTEAPAEASDAAGTDGSDATAETTVETTAEADAASENAAADGSREYTVRAGDSYWSIAAEVYGDPRLYRAIERANAANARRLKVGSVITIPARPE